MKTFKQFQEEQSVYSTKEFTKFGKSNYPKNTPYIIDDFIKNRAKELFKFKTGIPLAKKKSNNMKACLYNIVTDIRKCYPFYYHLHQKSLVMQ